MGIPTIYALLRFLFAAKGVYWGKSLNGSPSSLPMKLFRTLLTPLVAYSVLAAPVGARAASKNPDPAQVTIAVASLLEQVHYSKQKLNADISRRLLRNYLELIDYNHLFFTKEDVDEFTAKWADHLQDELIFGRTQVAQEIYGVYRKRAEDRISFVKDLLSKDINFNEDHQIEVNRQKLPWPAGGAAADQLWRDRITSELVQERLSKKPEDPIAIIRKRYDQFARNLKEQTDEDVVRNFLLSLARTYDPHSDYMSKEDQEQFNISMRLSLFGIGARLRSEDGNTKVEQLVPGGPASRSGKIKAGDRIVAVAQANGEFVECLDMKLDKVVAMIRGEKDTLVRLKLLPVGSTSGSTNTIVELKRDEIKLKEGDAYAELIEWVRPDGTPMKIGYLELPSFYRDFEQNGNPNGKSTTRDVSILLNRLKAEGMEGLVMDLRRDGGGSLEEAVNLTGLFISEGPVVQIKNWNGEVAVHRDKDPTISYNGPMVVLVSRQSASASEIFAAAMQDYGRALIVGDSKTFGKGTVQQLIELSKVIPAFGNGAQAGAVKLTIQKFYRVAGGSTQLRGVESHIVLPSLSDQPELGEDSLKDPLPYDTIPPVEFQKWNRPLFTDEIRRNVQERIPKNQEFAYIREDLERIRKYVNENKLSTNETVRKAEAEKDKARSKQRDAERSARPKTALPKAFRLTLDNATQKELVPIEFVEPKPPKDDDQPATPEETPEPPADPDGKGPFKSPPLRYDPVKEEAMNIMDDLVRLGKKSAAQ